MILGPNDPQAVDKNDPKVKAATARWDAILGLKPMSKKQKAEYDAKMETILEIIGWEEDE